ADGDVAENLGAATNDHSVANRGMTLSLGEVSPAQCDPLVERDVIAHLGSLADNHSHAVIDEKAAADDGAGMDLDSREPARELRECAGQKKHAVLPQPVMDAVPPQRVQAGVEQHDLEPRPRRGIAFEYRGDVFAHQSEVRNHN